MKYLFTPLLGIFLLKIPNASAQLKVGNGINIAISSGANVVLNNISLEQGNTAITGDGKILLTGASTINTISAISSIKNISLDKAGGSVQLLNNLSVAGTLHLINGKFDLNGYDLNLGGTGTLAGENESNHVMGVSGFIVKQAVLNAPNLAAPGNLGLSITSTANLGNTTIKRGNYASSDGSNFSIKRFFDISPANNTALNATIKLKYLEAELNGLQENQLQLLTSANGGSTWSKVNTATLNTTNNEVEATGLATLNRLTLTNIFTTLPISAIYVSGKQTINGIALNWNTVNETEVSHFWVEKSLDGKSFTALLKVASLSHIKKDNLYQAFDKNPIAGNNYYRIKAVDYNGDINTSLPFMAAFNLAASNLFNVYPNPTTTLLNGSFYAEKPTQVNLQVISTLGKIEITSKISTQTGLNNFSINVAQLPYGTYYLRLAQQNNQQTIKFIKN